MFFFFNDTATTEIYTLSLHDALPIYTRLIGIITRRNLNSQLSKGDSSSIPEIIDILIRNGVIPNEGRSRESAEVITAMGERVDKGELITPVEFGNGTYTNAIDWFDTLLPDIER